MGSPRSPIAAIIEAATNNAPFNYLELDLARIPESRHF